MRGGLCSGVRGVRQLLMEARVGPSSPAILLVAGLRRWVTGLVMPSGGRRGSSAEGQGDVLGTTVDTCSASVPPVLMPYFSSFHVKVNSDPEVVFLALWRVGVHAERRSGHSRSFSFPCLHLEFGQYVMSPLYLAVPVRCLVCGAMLGSTKDTCSASPGWLLEVLYDFLRDWVDSAPEVDWRCSGCSFAVLGNLFIISTSLLGFPA